MKKIMTPIFLPVLIGALVLAVGCGKDTSVVDDGKTSADSDDDSGTNTGEDNGLDSEPGYSDDTGIYDISTECDYDELPIVAEPVSLMILVDRSSSMVNNNTAEGKTRWQAAVAAFDGLLRNWDRDNIKLGLDYFPDGSGRAQTGFIADCGVDNPVQRDCADDNAINILDRIKEDAPEKFGNMTPMYCAMNNFSNKTYAPGCAQDGLEQYLLVVSDGSDNCGLDCKCTSQEECDDRDTWTSTEELGDLSKTLLDKKGIRTFVIGFGGGVDGLKLDAVAQNGGTAFSSYIPAEDGTKLEDAFDMVAGSLISCTWKLKDPNDDADPNKVNILFDDEPIPNIGSKDCATTRGWRWLDGEHSAVQFCGSACSDVKSQKVDSIQAVWGCDTIVVI